MNSNVVKYTVEETLPPLQFYLRRRIKWADGLGAVLLTEQHAEPGKNPPATARVPNNLPLMWLPTSWRCLCSSNFLL